MGIHKFFAYLSRTFSHLIKHKLESSLSKNSYVDGLYIDLNSPLHQIAQRIFKYALDRDHTPEDLAILNYLRDLGPDGRKQLYFRTVGMYLLQAYIYVDPKKIFMIAVDGVAPKAKMVQQRMRRFKSKESTTEFFDSTVLSAGTPFMDELDEYIRTVWMSTYKNRFRAGMNIVYSSHREKGEGEHKIFDQMNYDLNEGIRVRVQGAYRSGNQTPYSVLLGADSDLIVVSFTRSENIIFMRDNLRTYNNSIDVLENAINAMIRCPVYNAPQKEIENLEKVWIDAMTKGFQYVDLTRMRKDILETYISPNDIIDFVLISMFVGNDFIPAIPEFEAVTVLGQVNYNDYDIEQKYMILHNWVLRENASSKRDKSNLLPPILGQKGNRNRFNKDTFWKEFKILEATWTLRKSNVINYAKAQGIYNPNTDKYEIYPYQPAPLSETLKRTLLVKRSNANKWTIEKEDVGSLGRILAIYKLYMNYTRENLRGQSGSFLIERTNEINYVNFLRFLKELNLYGIQFLETNAENYEDLQKKKMLPDPLILGAVGITSGKNISKSFVPAAYSSVQKVMAFGIYDSRYADKSIPKQSMDEMCRKWLEGVQWTLRYYSTGFRSINTQWFYPFLNSPTLSDLITFLEDRLVCNIQEFPAIKYDIEKDFIEIERISISGGLQIRQIPDPNQPGSMMNFPVLNRDLAGTIYTYVDQQDTKIHQYRVANGTKKYIDLLSIHLTTPPPGLIQGTTVNITDPSLYIDPSKSVTLVVQNRELRNIDSKLEFVLKRSIMETVSDVSEPYASTLESFFSIMPVRVLKLILSPWMVDFVLDQISDCFPFTYESITEGRFYSNDHLPKIPYPSPTRIQKAIDNIPEAFNLEIGRLNKIRRREILQREGVGYGVSSKSFTTQKGFKSISIGYKESNVAKHTTQKQEQTVEPSEYTRFVTGGFGDSLGIPLPEYRAYYDNLIQTGMAGPVEQIITAESSIILTSSEIQEETLYKDFIFQFEPTPNPINLVINYNILKSSFAEHHITYPNLISPKDRRLLINAILFMSKYAQRSQLVVMVGVSPGNYLPMLSDFFPNHRFEVWDLEPITIPRAYLKEASPQGTIQVYQDILTPEKCIAYRAQNPLFISNYHSLPIESMPYGTLEERNRGDNTIVMLDNQTQIKFLVSMNASVSMLRFNLPNNATTVDSIEGEIWLQPWTSYTSMETQLIVDSINFVQVPKTGSNALIYTSLPMSTFPENYYSVPRNKVWQTSEYRNKIFYFNLFVKRVAKINNSLGITPEDVKTLSLNFDSAYEIYAWEQWILYKLNNAPTTLQDRKNIVVSILKAVNQYTGKNMNYTSSTDKNIGNYDLPFVSRLK